MILHYLPCECLSGFSLASPSCFRLVQSQLDRRVAYYLSPQTPSKLKMMLSDPAMMQRCEALELSLSRSPVKQRFFGDKMHSPKHWPPRDSFISLKVSRDKSLDSLASDMIRPGDITQMAQRVNYSKIIQLDNLDFLYQMCFAIYECKSNSSILVSNLCGGRVKTIRLWSDWFTEGKTDCSDESNTSSNRLFTKLVWTDRAFGVGFIVSAYGPIVPEKEGFNPDLEFMVGTNFDSRFYRIEVEEMVIRNRHILGLFEGRHASPSWWNKIVRLLIVLSKYFDSLHDSGWNFSNQTFSFRSCSYGL